MYVRTGKLSEAGNLTHTGEVTLWVASPLLIIRMLSWLFNNKPSHISDTTVYIRYYSVYNYLKTCAYMLSIHNRNHIANHKKPYVMYLQSTLAGYSIHQLIQHGGFSTVDDRLMLDTVESGMITQSSERQRYDLGWQ